MSRFLASSQIFRLCHFCLALYFQNKLGIFSRFFLFTKFFDCVISAWHFIFKKSWEFSRDFSSLQGTILRQIGQNFVKNQYLTGSIFHPQAVRSHRSSRSPLHRVVTFTGKKFKFLDGKMIIFIWQYLGFSI